MNFKLEQTLVKRFMSAHSFSYVPVFTDLDFVNSADTRSTMSNGATSNGTTALGTTALGTTALGTTALGTIAHGTSSTKILSLHV